MIFDEALLQEEIEAIYNGDGGVIVSYAYDALSARVSARYGNGTSAEYYYDMADRLLGLDNQTNYENLSYDYSYDNANNRLTMLVNGTDLHSYTYDNIYQLTNVDYPEDFFTDNTSFTYDGAGNRWQVIGSGLGPYYSTNNLNQYINAGTVYFSYDDNGNLTGDGTDSYTYDAENRLITANTSGLSIAYSYDPLGRRISKTVGGETTYYIYDGDQVICEYDGAGNLRKRFFYGVGIDEVVRISQVGRTADIWGPANEPDGTVDIYDLRKMSETWLKNEGDDGFNANADLNYDEKINNTDSDILSANWLSDAQLSEEHFYYHYDGLGSVIALSDSIGRVVEKYQYAVYGNPLILNQNNKQLTESKYGNPYMFTGRRFDTETCLYYYRARYYSTEIGRFLQVDAIGYADSMNLYIYVGNNPVVWVDPYGLCGEAIYDYGILSGDEFIATQMAGQPKGQDYYEDILDAQRRYRKRRPSIKDDPEWEGAKKRPKSRKIESVDKSKRRSKKIVEDTAKGVAVAGGAVATYIVVEKVVAGVLIGSGYGAPVGYALILIPP